MSNTSLNSLLVHNKSKFVLPLLATMEYKGPERIEDSVARFTNFALKYNVVFENLGELLKMDSNTIDNALDELITILGETQKDAWIFRKDFSTKEELESYSITDYFAIYAQYSLTYGWSDEYRVLFGHDPQSQLDRYFERFSNSKDSVRDLLNDSTYQKSARKITIHPASYLDELLTDTIGSNVPLSTYQKSLIEAVDRHTLANFVYRNEDLVIPIGETKVFVLSKVFHLLRSDAVAAILDRHIKRASEVVQFFGVPFLQDGEQMNTETLKRVRMNNNKTVRKQLLTVLNNIGVRNGVRGAQVLCEDMFRHFNFWKRLDKHLRWHKNSIMRRRYPVYMEAMDLLYKDDRSWTFNGRYSGALVSGDFNTAAMVASEQPGFFMRNIINLMRMSETGAKLPVKIDKEDTGKTVTIGAEHFFLNNPRFVETVNKIPLKHLVQLHGMMRDKDNLLSPVESRVTNGVPVSYSVPIPGVSEKVWESVLGTVFDTFKEKLLEVYDGRGRIFVDYSAEPYAYSSSGRKAVDTAFSSELLTSGSYIDLDDLNVGSDKVIRLGVIWRGKSSVDIDHSVMFSRKNAEVGTCYYGSPELKIDGKLVAVSSGDITSNHHEKFSCEFIDIDMDLCKEVGIDSIMSTIQNYGGGSISEVECYTFVKVIDRKDRVSSGSNDITVDLADTDYACSVSQNATGVIGFYMLLDSDEDNNLKSGSIYAINDKLVDHKSHHIGDMDYVSEKTNIERFLSSKLSVYDVLSHREVSSPDDCHFIVSANAEKYVDYDVTVFHPSKDYDQIMSKVFTS